MWNVLIVDDEKKVCELIKHMIPWEALRLQLVATAYNGLEAKEILKRESVDIVITDARMPECDGIQLVKWCHQQKKTIRYIVISGYRHFEYAHGALQYGVDAYLLKPINQSELIQSLQMIIEKLEQKRQEISNNEEMQQRMLRNREHLRKHFIGSYIFDGQRFCKKEIDSVDLVNEEFQLQFLTGVYRAIFIKVDNTKNTGYKIEKLLNKMCQITEAYLAEFCNEVLVTNVYSGTVAFFNYSLETEPVIIEKIEFLYQEIEKIIDIFEGLYLTLGVGTKETYIQKIHTCVVTATDAVKYRIVVHKGIIEYDKYQYEMLPVESVWTLARQNLLENYMCTSNVDGIRKMIFDLKLEYSCKRNLSPVLLYDILQEIYEFSGNIFSSEVEEKADEDMMCKAYEESVDRAVTENMLWESILDFLLKCTAKIDVGRQCQQTKPIRMVKEYIDQHYMENITLETVAGEVNLTANYISAIFRREEGVNFLDYITAKRIEKASYLLRKSDLSMTMILEKVGYTSVKYFSRLFKKTLGMKPSEYRKLYS